MAVPRDEMGVLVLEASSIVSVAMLICWIHMMRVSIYFTEEGYLDESVGCGETNQLHQIITRFLPT